jgi:GT2 family glycosyltransferase
VSPSALDVVIVAYRSRGLLELCLRSLAAHPPSGPVRIVVVDNASNDGTVELVRSSFPDVQLVENTANVGFGPAANAGIRSGAAPYVLVLNPDTEVRPRTLAVLLELLEARPEIGIAGCRLERADGSLDHAARRSFPTPLSALAHLAGIGKRVARGPLAQYRAPDVGEGPVDAVNGAFMLIRRAALDEVGLFDEAYWMYMEDLDLCYRFAQAGWVTWYEPSVSAAHVKGGSARRSRPPKRTAAFYRSMARFVHAHPESVGRRWLLAPATVAIAVLGGGGVLRSLIGGALERGTGWKR